MEESELDLDKMLSGCNIDLDEDHVVTILYNLLCAVNYIHSTNVMHRDIKAANILIDGDCNIKICDFGLSRVMKPKTDQQKEMKFHQEQLSCVGQLE
jgi:mitogen-activated protein kinase 1/3